MSNTVIVQGLFSKKEFFIFRDSGFEIKCVIGKDNRVRSFKHNLTKEERCSIMDCFKVDMVIKKSI